MSPTADSRQLERLDQILEGLQVFGMICFTACVFVMPALGYGIPWGMVSVLILLVSGTMQGSGRRPFQILKTLTWSKFLVGVLCALGAMQIVVFSHIFVGYGLSVPVSVLCALLVVRWMRGGRQQVEPGTEPGSMGG